MNSNPHPKKQDIPLLAENFEMTGKMLDVATKLLFELEQVKDVPEKVKSLPISAFEQFVQLLPVFDQYCIGWRLENLTEDQLKQVEGIEHRLEEMEKLCLKSRSIMDYLLEKSIKSPTKPFKDLQLL